MNEQDRAMIRRDIAFIRDRDKYALRQPERVSDAAVWLITQGQCGNPARVIYTLKGEPSQVVGAAHPTDPMMWVKLHVRERDLVVVFEASRVNDGWALWRPGVTTCEAPDMTSQRHPPHHLVDKVQGAIRHWLEQARAEQAADAMRRAREEAGL